MTHMDIFLGSIVYNRAIVYTHHERVLSLCLGPFSQATLRDNQPISALIIVHLYDANIPVTDEPLFDVLYPLLPKTPIGIHL